MPPIWNPIKHITSQFGEFQEAQEQAWNTATQKSTKRPSASEQDTSEVRKEARTTAKIQKVEAQQDVEEDTAKPVVDWQGIWNNALKRKGLPASKEESAKLDLALFLEDVDSKDKFERRLASKFGVGDELEDSFEGPNVVHPNYLCPLRPSSPTFKSSFVFSDKLPETSFQAPNTKGRSPSGVSGSMMFKRCKQTKIYATEEGLGGSYMVIKGDEFEEEWEVLDGAEGEVEDDWDYVEEAERFKDDGNPRKEGFNGKMREFFEREKGKREQESKARKDSQVSW
jgi:hypothetical protein